MKNTKRIIALALGTILIAQCFCGCKGKTEKKEQPETDSVSQADISSAKAPVRLINHMTTKERVRLPFWMNRGTPLRERMRYWKSIRTASILRSVEKKICSGS